MLTIVGIGLRTYVIRTAREGNALAFARDLEQLLLFEVLREIAGGAPDAQALAVEVLRGLGYELYGLPDVLAKSLQNHLAKATAGAVADLHARGLPAHGDVDGEWKEIAPPGGVSE